MTPVPDQPLGFNREVDCNILAGNFSLLAQAGDVTQFQFTADSCAADPNLVYNGLFTVAGGTVNGWIETPSGALVVEPYFGTVRHLSGTTATTLRQNLIVSDGVLLLVRFSLRQTVGKFTFRVGAQAWTWSGDVDGNFSYYVTANDMNVADTYNYIRAEWSVASDAQFGNASIIPQASDFTADIYTTAGDLKLEDIPYTLVNGAVTWSIDWQSLGFTDGGCYVVKVKDNCSCGQGGLIGLDFNTGAEPSSIYQNGSAYWAVGTGWLIYNGTAAFFGPSTASIFYRTTPLCSDVEYTVTYTVSGAVDAQVRVSLGTVYGTWRNAVGTYTETITPTNGGSISFIGDLTAPGGGITITNVSIALVTPEYGWESETISYSETECCETHLLTICNDSDAMGMVFVGTGFAPSVRLLSHVRGTGYKSDRNAYTDSLGTSRTYYGRSRKVKEFAFDAPEYVHDFVRLAVIADHVFIDDTEYFVEPDEYPTKSGNENDDISGVNLPISLKTENTMNRRISDVVRGCGLNGAGLEVTSKPITGGTAPPRVPLGTTDGQIITVDG
jgi:hypothetical protein